MIRAVVCLSLLLGFVPPVNAFPRFKISPPDANSGPPSWLH
jgi:hypothetical protein